MKRSNQEVNTMSAGRPEDCENTRMVVAHQIPAQQQAGENWLRHGEGTEAFIIDAMILEGSHTIRAIAEAIAPLSENNADNIPALIGRVRSHIRHLRNSPNGSMAPHRLNVQEEDGVLSFNVG
jgi:hypothetical protein